ncbi:DUF2470 domain-containing protein [Aeromicrobium sp. Leaf350]|uniref:DUF2470 domain-containing protein n=1 Tax=Aeromicrobium sp. Leaf350 TaxID=2876565 RepID=UPI001E329843|nr:DUF2470 domain-containing protein [Aeromicrobium sp. Leaf350]
MTHTFEPAVVDAVLAHMNDDHTDDSLLIVRAFGVTDAESATMTGLDGEAGVFEAVVGGVATEVRVPWSEPITERAEIRREVVVLYDRACGALGLEPRAH